MSKELANKKCMQLFGMNLEEYVRKMIDDFKEEDARKENDVK
jgi:hypothetical protein